MADTLVCLECKTRHVTTTGMGQKLLDAGLRCTQLFNDETHCNGQLRLVGPTPCSCVNCGYGLTKDEGWQHRRLGHKIIVRLSPETKRARIAEWRRLAEKAKATGQAGAVRIFEYKANEMEKEVMS